MFWSQRLPTNAIGREKEPSHGAESNDWTREFRGFVEVGQETHKCKRGREAHWEYQHFWYGSSRNTSDQMPQTQRDEQQDEGKEKPGVHHGGRSATPLAPPLG